MTRFILRPFAALALLPAFPAIANDPADLLLLVQDVPAHGVVVAELPRLPDPFGAGASAPSAVATTGKRPLPVQLIPPLGRAGRWLAVLKLPAGGDHRVRVKLSVTKRNPLRPNRATAENRWVRLTFDADKQAGLPSALRFLRTKKAFDTFTWNDRLHDPNLGGFLARHSKGRIECVSEGPLCTAVRTHVAYAKPDGSVPKSAPSATYEWLLLNDLPLMLVRAHVAQDEPFAWRELHFLELNYPDESFGEWIGGEPLSEGRFTATNKTTSFGDWALLRDGPSAIGMLRAGRMIFYDGRGGYGTYLHAHATEAWGGWRDTERRFSAWLWLGDGEDPVAAIRQAAGSLPAEARPIATTPSLRGRIEAAGEAALRTSDPTARRRRRYHVALVEKLEAAGQWDRAAEALANGAAPPWVTLHAGDLAVALEAETFRVLSVYDLAAGVELAPAEPQPLFALTMKDVRTGRLVRLPSDAGWAHTRRAGDGSSLTLRWEAPPEKALRTVKVSARAAAGGSRDGLHWSLEVRGVPDGWSVWRVTFPQLAVGPFSRSARVLVPQAAGVVKKDVWTRPFRVAGTYPSGWTAMPFAAAYDAGGRTGLYVGVHDPNASTKDFAVEGDPSRKRVTFAFDHPAPNMGKSGTGFSLSGAVVWQLVRGDWFDACTIYRDWAREHAGWWPRLGIDGREDTPRWMRELCVWGMLGGGAEHAAKTAGPFVEAMGLPAGFHWYNWHEIPFDNDYPHYFPPKDGFTEAVAKIQAGCAHPAYVMPYINGRLWDTRDRGAKDREFTRLARPAATKNEKGEPYTETYGSKEADGTPVRLAVMCPTTKLWRERASGIVLRLMTQHGCKAVYMDQIAAAKPRLCFDASHGHPLGGGGWWVAAYGELLRGLRETMPPGQVLTTECNAEPYLPWFDGYLTWHWQYDGQVPAFPAVYGGAIQLFGRAYRGGPTKDRALRMKAGQQLVWGEQIGWIGAGVAKEKANAAFLRQTAQLRRRLVRYFHAGRMARPPRLAGAMPTVTADWQWSGVWPVTTDAVLTGAWESRHAQRLAMLFVNVSDRPVTAELAFDAAAYGLGGEKLTIRRITAAGTGPPETVPRTFTRTLTFEPERAWAWEVSPVGAAFEGKRTTWHGYDRYDFTHDGRKCIVVTPKAPAPNRPWIWRARFFGHEPQTDLALLKRGYHLAYIDVGGLFGGPAAVGHWNAFHTLLTTKHALARKPALEGMSRGGLIVFNWAAANPHRVACIYADAPVCDIRSWPGGKGKGKGGGGAWQQCLKAYGLTDEQAAGFRGNPIDGLGPLARANVPLLHVVGAADTVVPVAENTAVIENRYRALGGPIRVISKPGCGHHPHSLKDPQPIVEFVVAHTAHRDGPAGP